jgi:hypothetical protein
VFNDFDGGSRMAWVVGIDEAGYGPNIGPFVMTAVTCHVPDHCRDADLWHLLAPVVCRGKETSDGQLFIDDSKLVYTKRGLAGLERGILTTLGREVSQPITSLAALIDWACPDDRDELSREVWYRGQQTLPVHIAPDDWRHCATRFAEVCTEANVEPWHVRSVVVCPARFNALLDDHGSKGHVLTHALIALFHWLQANLPGDDCLALFIDKHGGRNKYAAMIQQACPGCAVLSEQECMANSVYRVFGLGRDVRLSFQPRADTAHLCVALASMASKYLREVLMLEFNSFWRGHLPQLQPTAGYPGDAARFFDAIRPILAKLGLREETMWRRK